jgi:hypothetical protein
MSHYLLIILLFLTIIVLGKYEKFYILFLLKKNMAIMSRAKKAKGQTWNIKNAQKEVNAKIEEEKPIDEEEHKKRIEKLKALGLI